jgi:hypothetical protein
VLGELEARGVCDRQFGSCTAWWVAHETRADRSTLAARVRTAGKLRGRLDRVDAALGEGEITFDHARVLAKSSNPRVTDEIAAEQDVWLAKAADRPFKVWHHELRCRVELLDQDGPFDPERELGRNTLSMHPIGSDAISFKGELTGPHALALKQLIEGQADELFRRHDHDHTECPELAVPARATLLALALVELLRLGAVRDRDKTRGPVIDLTLVWNIDRPDVVESLDGDFKLTFDRFTELFCDPLITPMTINGAALDLGRSERHASRAQRRTLALRDGGCVFPGCDTPANWCDAHHVIHWHHDGPTDICNLALLCRRHHGITHRTGWTMTTTDNQHFTWTTPSGRTLHSQRHRGRPPDP